MSLDQVLTVIVNGLTTGSIYALIGLGLTLIFGLLDIVNFAHGQLLLLATYSTFALYTATGSYWLAVACVAVAATAIGAGLDVALFARARAAPITGLLISVGLIAIVENVLHEVWGPTPRDIPPPVSGVIEFGFVRLPATRLFVMVATIVILVAIALFLKRTKAGVALRAAGESPEAASLMGVSVERIRHLAFAVGTLLAALAGALIAMILPVEPVLGDSLLVVGFIALIVGGAGSPLGAVVGGLLIGVIESIGISLWSGTAAQVLTFGLLIVVFYFRPTGIVSTAQGSRL
ncbi:branched-chain amino acid ABC transporter permease [Rhodococcus sp. ACPA1]|uniref:branched-chain amino acid ABC transporter permease n=1 Tax=Rhodococcus sp. ACPA1 TaxID=2028572 RepID=UPI000BB0F87B|nr:branched-chain amino acid ABC transporter permease [Rhodococcus sp. ACPA1]PBC47413.1 hypothetical protein CJ177_41275 [Rhodococcus sp. ACPA1]